MGSTPITAIWGSFQGWGSFRGLHRVCMGWVDRPQNYKGLYGILQPLQGSHLDNFPLNTPKLHSLKFQLKCLDFNLINTRNSPQCSHVSAIGYCLLVLVVPTTAISRNILLLNIMRTRGAWTGHSSWNWLTSPKLHMYKFWHFCPVCHDHSAKPLDYYNLLIRTYCNPVFDHFWIPIVFASCYKVNGLRAE